jgi:hypothetical protein
LEIALINSSLLFALAVKILLFWEKSFSDTTSVDELNPKIRSTMTTAINGKVIFCLIQHIGHKKKD